MDDNILKDSRFSKLLNDPRYRQIPKHERKVTIDKRFQSMFNDDKFKVKYTIDKRGRPMNETSTENLRKYYEVDSNEDVSSDEESGSEKEESIKEESDNSTENVQENLLKTKKVEKTKLKKKVKESSAGEFVKPLKEETSNGPEKKDLTKQKNDKPVRKKLDKHISTKLKDLDIDYARGEGLLLTDSSSDDDTDWDEEDNSDLEHNWGEFDDDAVEIEDSTHRLAICNMDWDNIKAKDIMVLLSSFLPTEGVIKSITIYPSDYGMQRMKEEDLNGPMELTKEGDDDEGVFPEGSDNEEGSSYNMERLRKYQLNRLKYYYAVVDCDSVATADRIYSECNGLEYESSSTKLDLRFIPDDCTFEQEPREVCNSLPDLTNYKPRLFTTTALQQSKVDLTWDITDPNRCEAIKTAMGGGMDDANLQEYLASSDDSADEAENDQQGIKIENVFEDVEKEEDDDVDPIQKYKNLLLDIQQKEDKKKSKDVEMEVTWGLGVKEKAEELVNKKKITEEKEKLTPFEELMDKRREKSKQRRLERQQRIEALKKETANSDENEDSDSDIPSDVDMNDPYFAEEFDSEEFKKDKKKKKKKKKHESDEEIDEEEEKRKAELELLLDDNDDGKAHFSLKKIQVAETETKKSRRKRKLREKIKEIKNALPDFEIDTKDERFSALYNSHLYNIDPTDPNYKKTKNMEKLIEEKLKRRPAEIPVEETSAPKKTREQAELSLLVKNIKRKTNNIKKN